MGRARGRHEDGDTPWSKRARYPLDWRYNSRIYLMALLLLFGLVWGGFAALTGIDRRGNSVLGALAFGLGGAMTAALVAYLRRPTRPRPEMPSLRDDLVRMSMSLRHWWRRRDRR